MSKKLRFAAGLLALCSFVALSSAAYAETVIHGPDPVVDAGGPDGWSLLNVFTDPIVAPSPTNTVGMMTTVNYWADRGDGAHRIQPLLVKNEGGVYTIIGVGTEHAADANGLHTIPFGLTEGTDTFDTSTPGVTYHSAVLQQVDGGDQERAGDLINTGATIPFGGPGNALAQDTVGPNHDPNPGDVVTAGHTTALRGYAYSVEIDFPPIPEPSTMILAWIGLFGLLSYAFRRRKRGVK